MRKLLISVFLILDICFSYGKEMFAEDQDWIMQAQHVNEEAIQWLKEHLKERLASENLFKNPLDHHVSSVYQKNCQTCGFDHRFLKETSSIYVFMSFSLEDRVWVQFSKELEKIGGTFILRGLPQNSFKEIANRIFDLQDQGVMTPIQIHPKLFEEFNIQLVPSIVIVQGNQYDKISGNISLKYALEKMSQQGETNQAKAIYQQWKVQERS